MTLVNVLMMRELQMFTLLLHFMMMASFLVSCSPKERIASCLSQHNVNNFTTFTEVSTNSFYYRLLNFSIQNLRFAEVSFPKPLAIVIPENVEQLVRTVGCCRDELLEIRVRCGGHSYEGTSYISTNGAPFVIIDMMKLNKVSVDVKAETALVEGGATLGEAYYAIAEASNIHGFSAGSCPTVGAGGHIGGGGFGLLSRKYGLAADNVVDAQLVDADGRLLNRDAMGEDVFWAIRGGGGGVWGIVYAWKIKLVKVPETVTSCVISRPGSKAHVAELVNKWQHVAPVMNGDFYLSCFMGAGLPEATTTGLSTTFKGFYLGPRTEAISILNQTFPELQITRQECKEMSWIESIVFFSELAAVSSAADLKNRYLQEKNYFKGKADYVRKLISLPGIKAALDKLEKEPKGRVLLDPYGGVMNNISSQYIPFPHRKGNLYAIQYLVEWKEKDNERSQEYVNWIREFYETMTPYVSDTPRAAYINYMDFDIGVNNLMGLVMETGNDSPSGDAVEIGRVWGEKYFLKNYDRLVKAKTLIDPLNVFKHPQSIPPMSHSLLSYSAF